MRKIHYGQMAFWAILFSVFAILGHVYGVKSDTGHEGATRIERGSYLDARKVSPSSTTGTALFPVSVKRPDGRCYNNSGFVVWLGTVSAAQQGTTHSNILNGFPMKSSDTFNLDGSFTGGDIYATSDAAQGTGDLRCLDFLVR